MHDDALVPKLKTLPKSQRLTYERLGPTRKHGFVLYGGTALALRLGHRVSLDFDFFSNQRLDKTALRRDIPVLRSATVVQSTPDTWTLLVPEAGDTVKLSFFGALSLGRVGVPSTTADGTLRVASLDDLFATKLKAMFDRVECKDYLDAIALLKAKSDLAYALGAGRALFGNAFQPAQALKTLTYFEGGDLDRLTAAQKRFLEEKAAAIRDVPRVALESRSLT